MKKGRLTEKDLYNLGVELVQDNKVLVLFTRDEGDFSVFAGVYSSMVNLIGHLQDKVIFYRDIFNGHDRLVTYVVDDNGKSLYAIALVCIARLNQHSYHDPYH